MKTGLRLALLLALLAGGFWLWRVLFPGDEVLIRQRLQELAAAASFEPNEAPLVKVTNAARLANFFTPDGTVDVQPWGYQRAVLAGRDELRQAAVGVRNALASLTVEARNVEVTLTPETGQASVRFTLVGRSSRDPEPQSQEMRLDLRKLDGEWFIQRASTVEYLRP